eukprot:jgi/Ulvmu1/2012/UM120_0005.1
MGGGAWPFLVGGLPCQVDSGNERDLSLLNSDNIAIIVLQRGMPSKRESSSRVDYVPALCTHRPSLLPIERAGEALGLELRAGEPAEGSLKPIKPTPEHLRAPRLPRGERRPPFSEPPVSFVRGHPCDLTETTLNNGYLGSRNDEERSEMRYVVVGIPPHARSRERAVDLAPPVLAAGLAEVQRFVPEEKKLTRIPLVTASETGRAHPAVVEGESPVVGGKSHLRLNTGERPIANKYREGKMKRTLKRESKSA